MQTGYDCFASESILVAASVKAACTSALPKITDFVQASRKVCQISTEFGDVRHLDGAGGLGGEQLVVRVLWRSSSR